ncbi:MAG: hypothetical protein DHS20C02_15770 [Micavibrio sp.]|nr:MAG: hypothetical protein DHS20C02_15770 [Micavibrio sp.]
MSKGWSEERRKQQAERCRQNKPWEKSTGPRTAEGKRKSSLNAFKHGLYSRSHDEFRLLLRLGQAYMIKMLETLEDNEKIRMVNERRARRKRAYRRGHKWRPIPVKKEHRN